MKDGVRIAAEVILPQGLKEEEKIPNSSISYALLESQ